MFTDKATVERLRYCPENNHYYHYESDYQTHWPTHQRWIQPAQGLMVNEAGVIYLTTNFDGDPDSRAHMACTYGINLIPLKDIGTKMYVPGTSEVVTKVSLDDGIYLVDGHRVFSTKGVINLMGNRVFATWMTPWSAPHTTAKVKRFKRMPEVEKAWDALNAGVINASKALYAMEKPDRPLYGATSKKAKGEALAMLKGGPVTDVGMQWIATNKVELNEVKRVATRVKVEYDYLCTKPNAI
jgi:hypothetical protein